MNMSRFRNTVVAGCLSLAVVVLLGAGCVQNTSQSNLNADTEQRVRVAATLYPVYDLVRTVGGDDIEVNLIVPAGVSEHYFDPTPSTIKSLQGVETIFAIGQGLDGWVESMAKNVTDAAVITLDQNVPLKSGEVHEHEEGEHEEEEEGEENVDPHYWLDPTNAIIMAQTIARELSAIDPDNAQEYDERANVFIGQLQEKDPEWSARIAALPKKHMVTFHDAFHYFADHFELEVVATFEPFPGKEPTPQYLKNLEKEINEHNVRVLFLEPQLSERSLQTFARDHGITLGTLDPLGGLEDRLTYIDLMEYNVRSIEQALK